MIIWLASYPKSGNTWVRAFLSAYYYSNDGKFTFELLKKIKQFPSKEFFDQKLLNVDEASQNWLIAQKKIKDRKKICFLKTHNVNGAFKGNSFTTTEFTAGAIYIVRDPRNVLSSMMNHYSLNESDALKMISSIYRNLKDENDENNYASYSFISSWSNNYNSWKLFKNINSLLIKYEDLENDKYKTFSKIVNFTNNIIKKERKIDDNKFMISFQSRFGSEPWLQPYTDETLEKLGNKNIKHLSVITPGFSADNIETLEEINMEGREEFLGSGGKRFTYIPCLNDSKEGMDLLHKLALKELAGWI